MPTLLIAQGLRFFFFSNEGNEPPHVHVEQGDAVAKFWLAPVHLDYAHRMKPQVVKRARILTEQHAIEFLEKWREHFGA